jgi:hypothetical protein
MNETVSAIGNAYANPSSRINSEKLYNQVESMNGKIYLAKPLCNALQTSNVSSKIFFITKLSCMFFVSIFF